MTHIDFYKSLSSILESFKLNAYSEEKATSEIIKLNAEAKKAALDVEADVVKVIEGAKTEIEDDEDYDDESYDSYEESYEDSYDED
jgi:thiamine biosynthesis lipoprotein ApbE